MASRRASELLLAALGQMHMRQGRECCSPANLAMTKAEH